MKEEEAKKNEEARRNADLFRNAYHVPYKKWSSNSLAIFAELSNTIVSGTHITDDAKLQPSITAINCPTDDKTGNLIFPTPEKETLSCPVTGKNLDKVAKLRLRNSKDAADTATAEGKVTPTSGDSSSATVEFQTKDLHNLTQPAYSVFSVSSKGVEQKTDLTMHFPTDPEVSSVSPTSIDISKDHTLLLTGKHLALVDKVVLANLSNTSQSVDIPLKPDAASKDTQLSVPLDAATPAMTTFGTSQVKLSITLCVGSQRYEQKGQEFSFIGAATPKTAAKGKTP